MESQLTGLEIRYIYLVNSWNGSGCKFHSMTKNKWAFSKYLWKYEEVLKCKHVFQLTQSPSVCVGSSPTCSLCDSTV